MKKIAIIGAGISGLFFANLLKNNSEGIIFGENAYNFVKENFSWSKIALDFAHIMTKYSDLFITKKRNNNL